MVDLLLMIKSTFFLLCAGLHLWVGVCVPRLLPNIARSVGCCNKRTFVSKFTPCNGYLLRVSREDAGRASSQFRSTSTLFFLWRHNVGIPLILPIWFTPAPCRSFSLSEPIICAIKKRKRYGFGRSSKIMLESACVIASKLGLLPPPLASLMREFGGGNGGGGGGWFGGGFGWGDIDDWKRRRKTRMCMVGIFLICCFGLWVILGKEMALDADLLLGGLGLLLFGFSVNGWRKGVKDWILGFCCCAFLGCLVLKRGDFRTWVKWFGTVNKSGRRKRRLFF